MKNANIPLFFLLLACALATANAGPIGTGDTLTQGDGNHFNGKGYDAIAVVW